MSILGAQTGELIDLAAQLGTTTGDIGAVHADTRSVAGAVTQEMEVSFTKALTGITTAMDTLRGAVESAKTRLDGTTWTGSNRETFAGAYQNFGGAMTNLEVAVNDAYMQFDGQMKQVGGLIEEFQVQVGTSLEQAQDSTTSMRQAVDAQRENLESVMNTGLTIG